MIKKIIFIISMLWGVAMAQCDSITVHTVTNVTSTSAQLNWTAPAGATSYFVAVFRQPGNVLVQSVSTTATFKVIAGLTQNTTYYAFVYVFCAVGPPAGVIDIFVPTHNWTTSNNATVYTPQKSTQFTYLKGDSMFNLPRVDTNINRAPNIGGAVVFKPQDSTVYYYDGIRWHPLGIDSFGIQQQLNQKVDSVTVVGSILYYWVNGVAFGQTLPAGAQALNLTVGTSTGLVAGTSTYSNVNLIGLGTDIMIFVSGITLYNYGNNSSFLFNSGSGTIDISPNVWVAGASLTVPLNQ